MNLFKDATNLYEYYTIVRTLDTKAINRHTKKICKNVFGSNIKPGTLIAMEEIPDSFKGIKVCKVNGWRFDADYTTVKYDIYKEAGLV